MSARRAIAPGQTLRLGFGAVAHERTVTRVNGPNAYFDDGDVRPLSWLETGEDVEIIGTDLPVLERVARFLRGPTAPAGLRPLSLPRAGDDAIMASWGLGSWTLAQLAVNATPMGLSWRLSIRSSTASPSAAMETARACGELAEFCARLEQQFAMPGGSPSDRRSGQDPQPPRETIPTHTFAAPSAQKHT